MKNYNKQNNPDDGKDQDSKWNLSAEELNEVNNRDGETEQNDGRIDDIDKAWSMAKAEDPYREKNIHAREEVVEAYKNKNGYSQEAVQNKVDIESVFAARALREAQRQSEIAGENYDAAKNGTETYGERIHRERKEASEKVKAERQAEVSKQERVLEDIKTQHKQKGLAGRFFSRISGSYGRELRKQKKIIENI